MSELWYNYGMWLTPAPICANNPYLETWYRETVTSKLNLEAKACCDWIYYQMLIGEPVTVVLSHFMGKWIATVDGHAIYIADQDPMILLERIGFCVTRE